LHESGNSATEHPSKLTETLSPGSHLLAECLVSLPQCTGNIIPLKGLLESGIVEHPATQKRGTLPTEHRLLRLHHWTELEASGSRLPKSRTEAYWPLMAGEPKYVLATTIKITLTGYGPPSAPEEPAYAA
jgi:hypothetical protein